MKYKLKELRVKKHKTQDEVAKAIGINRAAYSHYENGLRFPKVDTAIKMALYFQVKVEDIIFVHQNDTICHDKLETIKKEVV
ncbi:helix-turn-helix transcriptional regulator [Clostridium sp.]|uniref:helix-turn-helix transcriptional regulator n=1 Tax=Clostridium sp. TaxID=1506 RepID=UPI002FDEB429